MSGYNVDRFVYDKMMHGSFAIDLMNSGDYMVAERISRWQQQCHNAEEAGLPLPQQPRLPTKWIHRFEKYPEEAKSLGLIVPKRKQYTREEKEAARKAGIRLREQYEDVPAPTPTPEQLERLKKLEEASEKFDKEFSKYMENIDLDSLFTFTEENFDEFKFDDFKFDLE